MASKKDLTGIEIRHRQDCVTRDPRDHDCPCRPTFRAIVSDERRRKLIRSRTYKELNAAVNWRAQMLAALLRGEQHREDRTTVAQAGEQVLAGMRAGTLLTRSGTTYKPATIRGCEQSLRDYVLPALGRERVTDLERRHAQDLDCRRTQGLDDPQRDPAAAAHLPACGRLERHRGQPDPRAPAAAARPRPRAGRLTSGGRGTACRGP